MRPVLCAIDFSATSLPVLDAAFEMAHQRGTNVTVLYTYRLVQPPGKDIAEYRKNKEAQARQDFDMLIGKVKNKSLVKYEFRPEIGFLMDRLEAYEQQNKIGGIVICQDMAVAINEHKTQLLQDFIQSLKIPLLIVPKDSK